MIRKRYKQRPAQKNKHWSQGRRGLPSFIKNVAKKQTVKVLGGATLKRAPVLPNNVPKRSKNKTLKSTLKSKVTQALLRKYSKNLYNRMSGTNWGE